MSKYTKSVGKDKGGLHFKLVADTTETKRYAKQIGKNAPTVMNNFLLEQMTEVMFETKAYLKGVNYTKNKLNEVGTHGETSGRYHPLFDDPSWEEHEEGVTTKWGKGVFSNLLNNGHRGVGPGSEEEIKYDESFYTSIMGTATDIINNIENASYIKLREVSFSYRVDPSLINKYSLSGLDVRLSFRDLITISDYSGWDPETNMMQNRISGEDYFNQPQTWGANLSLYLRW